MKKIIAGLLVSLISVSSPLLAERITLVDGSGNEIGTAANPIRTSGSGGGDVANPMTENLDAGGFSVTNVGSVTGSGAYALDLPDANYQVLGTADSISTAITNATAGDTIVLGSGTYSLTNLTIAKALNLVGQGVGKTTLTLTATSTVGVSVTASNVSISGMTLNQTVSSGSIGVVEFDGTAGTIITGGRLQNVEINLTTSNASLTARGFVFNSASGTVINTAINWTATGNGNVSGALLLNTSAAEAATTINIYNSTFNGVGSSGTGNNYALHILDSSSSNDVIVNLFNSKVSTADGGGSETNSGALIDGSDAILNSYGNTFSGTDQDVTIANSGAYTSYGDVLVNALISGTQTNAGRLVIGSVRPDDYYSGDGTQGATVTTCTGFKDGLCISGT